MSDTLTTDQLTSMLDAGEVSLTGEDNRPEADTGADDATVDTGDEEISQADPEPEIDAEADPDEPVIEDGVEDEGSEDPDLPAITAPKSWNAERRAKFDALPREAQEIIVAQDAEREKGILKQLDETATEKKAASEVKLHFTRLASDLEQVLPGVRQRFADKWEGADDPRVWQAAFQNDPQQASILKAQYEADRAELQRAEALKIEADKETLHAHYRETAAQLYKMAETDPLAKKLVGPEGQARRDEVQQYLLKAGYAPEIVNSLGAVDWTTAHKAMLYDKAVAETAKKKAAAPQSQHTQAPATRARAPVGTTGKTQHVSRLEAQTRRLAQTHSKDDLIALMNLQDSVRSR